MNSVVNPNDAAGGAGSIVRSILSIALNGISRTVDGAIAKRYPLTYFNENQIVNANSELKPYSAPQTDTKATSIAANAFSNPIVIAVGAAVALSLIILLVVRASK